MRTIIIGLLIIILSLYIIKKYKPACKYKLAAVLIFKNEENYLEEWLQFHIFQGFDHFYLYNNDPDINKYNYLQKYKKYITLISWINKKNEGVYSVQRQAYTHCIKNFNKDYQWLALVDADEFISSTNNDKVIDFINNMNIETDKCIKIPRYNYGSSGHKTKPKGKIVENFTKREKDCSLYKVIANSKFINTNRRFNRVHEIPLINKLGKIYNSNFKFIKGKYTSCSADFKNETSLVMNHYYTKSYEEYLNRCKLWKNNKINLFGYRKCDTYDEFVKKNINEVEGFL